MTTSSAPKRNDQAPPEGSAAARRALAFGKYRLFARLGTGGMADVYLAVAQGAMNVNRLVVIKRLRDEQANDPGAREMFLNEARLAARLNHPNVIQTFEAGHEGGSYFLAMEYVDGQPLSRVLTKMKRDGKTIEPRLAARICSEALLGLHYAHELCDFDGTELKIVHRDVSPQNVMLTYDGRVKLVDFGIAKAVGTTQTAHGVFKGKVAFMAPEQVLGEDVDRRADLFAAGIVLWETVTGKPLMAEENPAKTLYNLMNKAIPRASEANPEVPAALDDIIARSLERDVSKRYQTAKEMRDALEGFITSTGSLDSDAIGELTKRLFTETREKVQAQIKAQLVTLTFRDSDPSLDANSSEDELGLTHVRSTGPMLIDLGDGATVESSLSNAAMFRVVTTGSAAMPAPPPSRTKRIALVAWVGITLLALGASGVALMRSQKADPTAKPAPTAAVEGAATTPGATAAAPGTPDATGAAVTIASASPPSTGTATATATNAAAATQTGVMAPAVQRPGPVAASRPAVVTAPAVHTPPTADAAPKATSTQTATPTAKPQDPPQGRTFRRDL